METGMKPHISTLIKYFEEELPSLKNSYQWKISEIDGFNYNSDRRSYSANVALKKHFNTEWHRSDMEGKQRLAKIIVSDWGGVRNNNPETLIKSSCFSEEKKIIKNTPMTINDKCLIKK